MRLTLRIILGAVLLAACIGKLLDLPGFVLVLHSYRFFPAPLHWPAAVAVVSGELLVGCWLLWGRRLGQAAYASLALHGVYASWASYMLLRSKPILNCGCFGSFLARPLTWWTVGQNLVLMALSLLLARLARTGGRA